MSLTLFIFYFLEGVAALSAVGILLTRNVFYGALLLVTCLLSIAGIFIFANAEFMAITQILIYAGGIVVLIIFGVMLTSKISGKSLIVKNQYWIAGSSVGLFFAALLIKLFSETHFYSNTAGQSSSNYNSINQIGILLMTDYSFAFELAGIVLLVALIGASVVAFFYYSPTKTE